MVKAWAGFCAVLLLPGCAQPGSRFVGPLVPDAPSAQCRPATASLVLRGADAVFTPDEGTWTLAGPAAGNRFQSERGVRTAAGTDIITRVDATWTADAATATYVTARCTYKAAMTAR